MRQGSKKPAGIVVVFALALLAPIATGCGQDGDASNSPVAEQIENVGSDATGSRAGERISESFETYFEARLEGEWKKACAYLTDSSRRLLSRIASRSDQIDGKTCAPALASFTKRLSPSKRAALTEAEVQAVRLDGNRGYVIYGGGDDQRFATQIMLAEGRWAFAPSVIPLQ